MSDHSPPNTLKRKPVPAFFSEDDDDVEKNSIIQSDFLLNSDFQYTGDVDSWIRSLGAPILPQINTDFPNPAKVALLRSGSLKVNSAAGEVAFWDEVVPDLPQEFNQAISEVEAGTKNKPQSKQVKEDESHSPTSLKHSKKSSDAPSDLVIYPRKPVSTVQPSNIPPSTLLPQKERPRKLSKTRRNSRQNSISLPAIKPSKKTKKAVDKGGIRTPSVYSYSGEEIHSNPSFTHPIEPPRGITSLPNDHLADTPVSFSFPQAQAEDDAFTTPPATQQYPPVILRDQPNPAVPVPHTSAALSQQHISSQNQNLFSPTPSNSALTQLQTLRRSRSRTSSAPSSIFLRGLSTGRDKDPGLLKEVEKAQKEDLQDLLDSERERERRNTFTGTSAKFYHREFLKQRGRSNTQDSTRSEDPFLTANEFTQSSTTTFGKTDDQHPPTSSRIPVSIPRQRRQSYAEPSNLVYTYDPQQTESRQQQTSKRHKLQKKSKPSLDTSTSALQSSVTPFPIDPKSSQMTYNSFSRDNNGVTAGGLMNNHPLTSSSNRNYTSLDRSNSGSRPLQPLGDQATIGPTRGKNISNAKQDWGELGKGTDDMKARQDHVVVAEGQYDTYEGSEEDDHGFRQGYHQDDNEDDADESDGETEAQHYKRTVGGGVSRIDEQTEPSTHEGVSSGKGKGRGLASPFDYRQEGDYEGYGETSLEDHPSRSRSPPLQGTQQQHFSTRLSSQVAAPVVYQTSPSYIDSNTMTRNDPRSPIRPLPDPPTNPSPNTNTHSNAQNTAPIASPSSQAFPSQIQPNPPVITVGTPTHASRPPLSEPPRPRRMSDGSAPPGAPINRAAAAFGPAAQGNSYKKDILLKQLYERAKAEADGRRVEREKRHILKKELEGALAEIDAYAAQADTYKQQLFQIEAEYNRTKTEMATEIADLKEKLRRAESLQDEEAKAYLDLLQNSTIGSDSRKRNTGRFREESQDPERASTVEGSVVPVGEPGSFSYDATQYRLQSKKRLQDANRAVESSLPKVLGPVREVSNPLQGVSQFGSVYNHQAFNPPFSQLPLKGESGISGSSMDSNQNQNQNQNSMVGNPLRKLSKGKKDKKVPPLSGGKSGVIAGFFSRKRSSSGGSKASSLKLSGPSPNVDAVQAALNGTGPSVPYQGGVQPTGMVRAASGSEPFQVDDSANESSNRYRSRPQSSDTTPVKQVAAPAASYTTPSRVSAEAPRPTKRAYGYEGGQYGTVMPDSGEGVTWRAASTEPPEERTRKGSGLANLVSRGFKSAFPSHDGQPTGNATVRFSRTEDRYPPLSGGHRASGEFYPSSA